MRYERIAAGLLPLILLTGCGHETASKETEKMTAEEAVSQAETEQQTEIFSGVLMDEDCSGLEDPPLHETNCMFMDECRASGYGLDIEQPDGSWVFYMFDERGQQLTWEYLNITTRTEGLYADVTGIRSGDIIKVISIEEK
jgi:flagellar basal body L-ring protein FlgH